MTGDPYATILLDARRRLEEARLDGRDDRDAVGTVIRRCIDDYRSEAAREGLPDLADTRDMYGRVLDGVVAYGPLTPLLRDPTVEEVFVEGARVFYVDGQGTLKGTALPTTAEETAHAVRRLVQDSGSTRDLTDSNPIVRCSVLDGTARLIATQHPITRPGTVSATVRKQLWRRVTLALLLERGSLTREAAGFLWGLAQVRSSILISGQPGAGKTSALAALLDAAPNNHVVRCCEEVQELPQTSPAASYYEAQDLPGQRLRDLVKLVLGMRPFRIVIGEVKGQEAYELTRAANAGCGFACTIHANSARDALEALVNAALMAGENVSEANLRRVFSKSIDLIVHLDMAETPEGLVRRIMEIGWVQPVLNDSLPTFAIQPMFRRDRIEDPLHWTGVDLPDSALRDLVDRQLATSGYNMRDVLEGRESPL